MKRQGQGDPNWDGVGQGIWGQKPDSVGEHVRSSSILRISVFTPEKFLVLRAVLPGCPSAS